MYTCVFILLMLLILGISGFLQLYITDRIISSNVSVICSSLSGYRENIREKFWSLVSMEQLRDLIDRFESSPSEELLSRINLCLDAFQAADSGLLYLMLQDEEENLFHSISYSSSGLQEYISSREAYRNILNRNTSRLSPVLPGNTVSLTAPFCYYLGTQTLDGRRFLITLCCDAETLVKDILTAGSGMDMIQIFRRDGECLFDSLSEKTEALPPRQLRNASRQSGSWLDSGGYHCYRADDSSSFYTVGTVRLSALLRNLFILMFILCAAYILPLAAVLAWLVPINDRMLQPVRELSDEVAGFSLGQPPIRIYHTDDEIEELSRSFQKMMQNINQQAKTLSQKERENAVTYYKLLTTQLDPHFIYNTMNIINILARQHAFEDIILVNTALTRVLRERLNTQNTTFDEIRNEIRTLRQYQLIMDYRYLHQVQVEYDVDPTIAANRIPKNILQPLIENAYYHGLTRDDGTISGTIGILIYPMDEEIVIEISDDGKGFAPEQLCRVLEQLHGTNPGKKEDTDAHIGIENIYRRIWYLYRENFSMDIRSRQGNGTTVVITLPLEPPR